LASSPTVSRYELYNPLKFILPLDALEQRGIAYKGIQKGLEAYLAYNNLSHLEG